MNPHDKGLCCSPDLWDQRENEESQKCKADVTFGREADTKVAFVMFLLIELATNITIPKHQSNPNATYTKQVMKQFHEVNELYYSTLNKVHHFLYPTEIGSN